MTNVDSQRLGNAAPGLTPWSASWPAHVPQSLDYPIQPAWRLLEQSVERWPDRVAIQVIDHSSGLTTQVLSYEELWRLARRVAATLRLYGLRPGDRVAFYMPNSAELVAGMYGAWLMGITVVTCSPMYTLEELVHQMRDSGAALLISDNELLETALPAALQTSIPILFDFDDLAEHPLPTPSPLNPAMAPAFLAYTGGTTGRPKGAVLSHYNVVANTIQVARWYDMQPGEERVIAALPLFHIGGQAGVMNVPLSVGATLLLMERFNPRVVASTIESERATRFFGVPTMYVAILNHEEARKADFSSLRPSRTGAAPLPAEVKAEFDDLAGHEVLFEAFGMSEAGPVALASPIQRARAGSVGIPLPDTDVRLVDHSGCDVKPGREGELLIRGPQVMMGYWEHPRETAETLAGGWLHTGDVARQDDHGYFSIVDRKKESIDAAGFKVWPREVEEVLYRNPAVEMAAVTGVPDAYRGETVKAYVVLKPGREASAKALQEFARRHLAAYKVPRAIEFVRALPVSPQGKVLRRELSASTAADR